MGDINNKGDDACAGVGSFWELLCLPLTFTVNLILLKEKRNCTNDKEGPEVELYC